MMGANCYECGIDLKKSILYGELEFCSQACLDNYKSMEHLKIRNLHPIIDRSEKKPKHHTEHIK